MQHNKVKAALKAGKAVAGPIVSEVRSPGAVRLFAQGGFDFLFLDTEHGMFDWETISGLVQLSLLADICPIVRPTDGTYGYVARAMDSGSMGVIVPRIDTPEHAAEIVQYAKYPPVGRRGAGGDGRNGYLKISAREAAETSNAESLVVLQIESKDGVDNVDAIAATEGVDVLLIGPQDLSVSLGVHGDFSHPRFMEAAQEVVNACKRHGKASGMVEKEPAAFRRWHDLGMRFLVCDSDSNMLYAAAVNDVKALNEFAER